MAKEIEDMIVKPLTCNQESMAVHYSVLFLRSEVSKLEESLKTEQDITLKKLLSSRLQELKHDLTMFEEINEGRLT